MSQVMLLSLVFGCSGIQTTVLGLWLQRLEQRQHQTEEEEERLTPYDSTETIVPNESRTAKQRDPRLVGWEFKILRTERELFRDPVVLQQVCDEEAIAGWILLEKLDDNRLRFKRPIAMREVIAPDTLGFDPYRSFYGSPRPWRRWLLMGVGVLALLVPAYLSFVLISSLQSPAGHSPESRPTRSN
jgi:hypothetical protein